tara:strand:- start:19 stop:693 length:675 start_codon:yes stop_codon:yes gene_type:complete
MPYSIDRKNKCIYKKKSDGSRGEKVGCTKGNIDNYIAALQIHADEGKKRKNMKSLKEMLDTNVEPTQEPKQKEIPGNLKTLYAVQKPYSGCQLTSLVKPINPLVGLGKDYEILPDQIHAVFSDEDLANDIAGDLFEEFQKKEVALEEKKGNVTNKIKKAIDVLEKKRKEHMEMAKEDPKGASTHREEIATIMNKVDDLMTKLEKIEKSKKEIVKEDDKKKKNKK